tara:strand:+ start:550 stop:942 length:393 start_codon:yes stop_codon:yes gene_type:complete
MRTVSKGFALVEIVIVIVLISGSMLVFLEALGQAKSYQVRSEVVTIQSLLLNSKTNQIRANGFNNVPISHGFITSADYPNYLFSVNTAYVNSNLNQSPTATNYKKVSLTIKHNSGEFQEISNTFIVTNAL